MNAKLQELIRRLTILWALLMTAAAIGGAFESAVWWAPLLGSPAAWAPLMVKSWRWSFRLGLSIIGGGFLGMLIILGNGAEQVLFAGLFFGITIIVVWEVIAFLAAPFLKKS